MYKIMLVEDEKIVREGMMQTIPWNQYGFYVDQICENGRDAIQQLPKTLPDVVITDICMPYVDGLELTKYIDTHFPSILVVILTGYNEFSYAQAAIKLQVSEFLLKPATPKEFGVVLEKIYGKIKSRESHMDGILVLKSQVMLAEDILQGDFFREIFRGELSEIAIRSRAKRLHIPLDKGVYTVVFLNTKQSNLIRLYQLTKEIVENIQGCECTVLDNLHIMVIIGGKVHSEAQKNLICFQTNLKQKTGSTNGITVQMGIGSYGNHLGKLHESAVSAHHALGFCFSGNLSMKEDGQDIDTPIPYEHLKSIILIIIENILDENMESAKNEMDRYFSILRENNVHRDVCITYLTRLKYALVDIIPDSRGENAPIVSNANQWYVLQQAEMELMELFDFVCHNALEASLLRPKNHVAKAKEYIQNHYQKSELSLEDVLKYINVSRSYFSAIFKAQTEQTFVEYLSALRMEEAKRLLLQTNLCIYEIAEKVGFTDPNYFSVLFKRYFGINPRKCRENQ